jgi:hypothetical protein
MLAHFKRNAGRKVRLVSSYGRPAPENIVAVGVLGCNTARVWVDRPGCPRSTVIDNPKASEVHELEGGFTIVGKEWRETVRLPETPQEWDALEWARLAREWRKDPSQPKPARMDELHASAVAPMSKNRGDMEPGDIARYVYEEVHIMEVSCQDCAALVYEFVI